MTRLSSVVFVALWACADAETRAPVGSEAPASGGSNPASGGSNPASGGSGSESSLAVGSSQADADTLDPHDGGTFEASAGGSAQGGAGGGQDPADADADAADPCPTPQGATVTAASYERPATTLGCSFDAASQQSATVTNEAEFLAAFACPETAASGIDFSTRRLRVTLIREAGFTPPLRHHAVLQDGTVRLGFELPVYCGGAFPPTAMALTLLPSGGEPVEDEVCRPGSCGSGGFPP
jgi:hypothetical protein